MHMKDACMQMHYIHLKDNIEYINAIPNCDKKEELEFAILHVDLICYQSSYPCSLVKETTHMYIHIYLFMYKKPFF